MVSTDLDLAAVIGFKGKFIAEAAWLPRKRTSIAPLPLPFLLLSLICVFMSS